MTDFFNDHAVLFALLCAGVGVLYGLLMTVRLLKLPDGDETMRTIAAAIQEGAAAYLNRQYRAIGIVAIVLAVIIGFSSRWAGTCRVAS